MSEKIGDSCCGKIDKWGILETSQGDTLRDLLECDSDLFEMFFDLNLSDTGLKVLCGWADFEILISDGVDEVAKKKAASRQLIKTIQAKIDQPENDDSIIYESTSNEESLVQQLSKFYGSSMRQQLVGGMTMH